MDSDILFIRLEDEEEYDIELRRKHDEFLDVYSLYRQTGLSWIKEELLKKAYQIHLLDQNFTFYV